jgi:ribosomal protein L35AE/L33A
MALKMVRTADKANLFEGRAETTASNNNLTSLMPNLVRAMFTEFPGTSGQTVRVRFNPNRPDQPASVRVVG